MVQRVECGTQIKQSHKGNYPLICSNKQTTKETQHGSLCAMVLPLSRLTDFKNIVDRQTIFQSSQNHFLKNLWDKQQTWHESEGYCRLFESSPDFFKRGVTRACLNCSGVIPAERETLTVTIIRERRSLRHYIFSNMLFCLSLQLSRW